MLLKLYHGSNKIIEQPQYGVGKSYNDYGLGFYCTADVNMAKEWGASEKANGYANAYDLECDGLRFLNLQSEEYNILHWLTILLENRHFDVSSELAQYGKAYLLEHFSVAYHDYDVIVGYRADDSYFSFAQDFLNGTISYRKLSEAMHLGKLGLQYVLKSRQAFERLDFTGYEIAESVVWYEKKRQRDMEARRSYFSSRKAQFQRDDIYIANILGEEMKPDDTRLR